MSRTFQNGFSGILGKLLFLEDAVYVRTLLPQDLDSIVTFWKDLEPEVMQVERGVILSLLPSKEEMLADLRFQINRGLDTSEDQHFVLEIQGRGVGSLYLERTEILETGKVGYFHLHLWTPDMRRQGLMKALLPDLLRLVYDLLDIDTGIGVTSVHNIGINRLLDSLKIPRRGPIEHQAHFTQAAQPSFFYELSRNALKALTIRSSG